MKLIKINTNNYTTHKKYFIQGNYELKCRIASIPTPNLYDVDQTFLTDEINRAEYEIVGNSLCITFTVYDVVTEILLNQNTGDIKVHFDFLPSKLDSEVKTAVVKFLKGILSQPQQPRCNSCRYKHQFEMLGICERVYWK